MKVAPFALAGAVGPDAPAVELDDVPDDGETETEAGFRPRAAGVGLTEALEDVGQELAVDALCRCR